MVRKFWFILLITGLSFSIFGKVRANDLYQEVPEGPIYIVQEGDSLWDIAARFRVSLADLQNLNGITNPGQLVAGARLVIPGLPDVQGILTTRPIQIGENLRSLSRHHQVSEEILLKLNHLTSPVELYAGATLVIPEQEGGLLPVQRILVSPGQSLLELAILEGTNPWALAGTNQLAGTWAAIPGDVLHLALNNPESQENDSPSALPGAFSKLTLEPDRIEQGKVMVIEVEGAPGITLFGELLGREVSFFPDGAGRLISLQGIHVMTDPGLYSITFKGSTPDGSPFAFEQPILIYSGNYPFDPVLIVSPETIDPTVTKPEDAQWAALTSTKTPEKLWNGIFSSPAPAPYSDCWPSLFGNRRSYNGSEYIYFHSGLDFCGGVGTEILAPAAGRVVFAGPLTVRGNATIIDHGWGVYTGYLHQSEILVQEGDLIQQGQVIGKVGGTGRVTGPHLHWEVWAGGVQVDPMDWLSTPYPH